MGVCCGFFFWPYPRSGKPVGGAPMSSLTIRQTAVLDFICDYIERHKFPPTVRDIGDHFGIRSPNGVRCHLRVLEKQGVIYRHPGLARGIVVTM